MKSSAIYKMLDNKILTGLLTNDGSLFRNTGVLVSTPPSATVKLPKYVNSETGAVFIDDECGISVVHVSFADQTHEYKYTAQNGECSKQATCPLYHDILLDHGYFQHSYIEKYIFGGRNINLIIE